MSEDSPCPTEVMSDLARHGLAPTVLAAQRCGLLEALGDEPATAEALAARCGVVPRGAALVLDALASAGVCERVQGGYRRDRSAHAVWPWSGLLGLLTEGSVVSAIDDRAQRGALYATAVEILAGRFAEQARLFAATLGPAERILDVGCGSGVWSLAMLARSATARLVGLDLAEIVPLFVQRASTAGLADRVEGVVSDYFTDAPVLEGRRFDRVVLANVLHLEDAAGAETVLRRWAGHVAPSGQLVVIDCIPDGSTRGELERAFYALHLGLRTARGGVHEPAALERWSAAGGLGEHEVVRARGWPGFGALVARRPR